MKRASKYFLSVLAFVLAFSLAIPSASAAWEVGFTIPASKKIVVEETKVDPVAAFKAEVLKLINEERAKVNLAALTGNESLAKAAATRAKEAATKFAHVRPDGSKVSTVFTENAITYQSAGETLANGYSNAADLVKGWMNSSIHKDVLLGAKFTNAELGYFQNAEGKVYSALLLYAPAES